MLFLGEIREISAFILAIVAAIGSPLRRQAGAMIAARYERPPSLAERSRGRR